MSRQKKQTGGLWKKKRRGEYLDLRGKAQEGMGEPYDKDFQNWLSLSKYYYGDEIMEDEMWELHRNTWKDEITLETRIRWEDNNKMDIRKQKLRMWTSLTWLKIGSSGGILEQAIEIWLHKRRKISWPVEQLTVTEVALCLMNLAIRNLFFRLEIIELLFTVFQSEECRNCSNECF